MAAVINSPFFDNFPKVKYDINNVLALSSGGHETVVDIFFRFGFLKNILNNASSYYVYEVQDSDTPEIIAERTYGDAGAGWIIIYANKIVDPLFDWPLNYDAFNKMILDRYGTLENAKSTTHHCEKIISRYNTYFDTTTETRFIVDNIRYTEDIPEYPYSYYTPYTATTFRTTDSSIFSTDSEDVPFLSTDLNYDDSVNVSKTGSVANINEFNTYEVDGKTIHETIRGESISCYDYELKLNDSKKLIKVVKSNYYPQIMQEFNRMTGNTIPYIRTLV